jgi:FkbM family methyltransferase
LSTNTFSALLKAIASKVLPAGVREAIGRFVNGNGTDHWRTSLYFARMRRKMWKLEPGTLAHYSGYTVRITDGPNFYMQCKDEFMRRIYHFEAQRPDPLIIDGGSNMGIAILYFKYAYPRARIIGFEPDPAIFRVLQENVSRNRLTDVKLINASLGTESGTATFLADGSAAGRIRSGENSVTVRVERLSDHLTEPVDFLKLNIEGEELPVLQEAAASGKLRTVRELVLEYHGWAKEEQRLGAILDLLDRHGFRYLIHDFDVETCAASKPPFRWTPQTTWFCLVYARRESDEP